MGWIRERGAAAGGDGSGAFGAVLKEHDSGDRGLFIYGDETDPSWHLRGVERQIEEAAARSGLIFPGEGTGNLLTVRFGDTSRDDNAWRVSSSDAWAEPESINAGTHIDYSQHDDPSAVKAERSYGDDVIFRAVTAGAAGNNLRATVTRGTPGTDAIPAVGAVVPITGLGGTPPALQTVVNATFPAAQGATRNGAQIELDISVADAAEAVIINSLSQNAARVTFPPGAEYNDGQVRIQSTAGSPVAATANLNVNQPSAESKRIDLTAVTAGTAGNGIVVSIARGASVASNSVEATYASATRLDIRANGQTHLAAIVSAVNAARHNGSQLVSAAIRQPAPTSTTVFWPNNPASNNGRTVTLAGGAAGTPLAQGAYWDATNNRLTYASGSSDTISDFITAVNGLSAFGGSAAAISNRGNTFLTIQAQNAVGGTDADPEGTITWDDDGGTGGTGLLTVIVTASTTATALAGYINGLTAFPGTAAVVAGRGGYLPAVGTYTAAGGVTGVDAVARTPISITLATSGTNPVRRTMIIGGVLQNTDTIAQVQAALAASTSGAGTYFEIVGVGTDAFLTTQSDLNQGSLIGGEDALPRQDTTVGVSGLLESGAPLVEIDYYGTDTPEASRTTLTELRDAFAVWSARIVANGGVALDINLSGSGAAVIDADNLPAGAVGGRNYVPPSPIEFLVRGADEADGKNIEVRYHADHDTLQEILDASLLSATNPGGAKVVAIYGTDLSNEPEEPPVTRRMYPEGGVGTSTGLNAGQVRDTVEAFLQEGTNITIQRDGNALTISSTGSGTGGGLDAEAVRDTVAAFLRAATNSPLRVVHDDNANTLTVSIVESTENIPGVVRNVSVDEASDTAGTVFRAWSSAMISKLVNILWGPPSRAEARAGTSNVNRLWSSSLVRDAITSAVPAVFRTGNRDRIPADKLPELDDSLIEKIYEATVAANAAIFTVDGVTVANDANEAYYLRVGATSEFTTGTALFAATSSNAVTVEGVRFWTVGGALRIGSTGTEKAVVVWKVDDLAAIRATVQQAITQPATWARDGNTDTLPDAKLPAGITRDTEIADSVTGLSLLNRVLTGTRRSGSNPIEVNLAALASGAGVPLGSLRSLGFWHPAADASNGNFLATGIMLPAAPSDESVFLITGKWGTSSAYASINGSVTGALIKALPTLAAGATTGGTEILVEPIGDTTLFAAKLASGELLLRNDEGEWVAAGDYFAMYEILDAAAAGRIVNPEETVLATVNAGGRYAEVQTLNPANPEAGTKATPANIGLLTAGSTLADWASDLDEAADTVTLEPGTYIGCFLIASYNANTGNILAQNNARGNTYHDAVMDIGGTETIISCQITESYIRPINTTNLQDANFGGFASSIILRVPAKGAVTFRKALTGQGGSPLQYLGSRSLTLYRLTGPDVPRVATPPSISSFSLDGDLMPAAGAISETYDYAFTVAQSSHLTALRIVRFTGTDAEPASVTVLATIAQANWHGGSGQITVSGFNLAAGATETVRLEAYGEGQTPGTDQPVAYHDVRITAHATTAATRFIRVPRTFGSPAARPTAATLLAALAETGAGVIATGGTVIGDWVVSGIPASGDWLVGWIVAQSGAQPNHYTQAGIQIDVAVAARFAFSQNGVDYYVYLFADTNYVDSTYNNSTITVT